VCLVFCPLLDPAPDGQAFRFVKALVSLGGGHDVVRVFREDAFDHQAVGTVARGHGRESIPIAICVFCVVESETCLASSRVWTVAGEAIVGEDRPDLLVVRDGSQISRSGCEVRWSDGRDHESDEDTEAECGHTVRHRILPKWTGNGDGVRYLTSFDPSLLTIANAIITCARGVSKQAVWVGNIHGEANRVWFLRIAVVTCRVAQ